MSISKFNFPTPIFFGPGASQQVAEHLSHLGLKRPLIVTDKGIESLPLLSHFRASLNGLEIGVFAGVQGNPVASQVMAGAAAYRAHNGDCVIGFGGGAALDVAKVVGLLATHPGDAIEYAWDHPNVRPITKPLPYFVALPTTSGTGSEVGRSSVISEDASHIKRVIFSPQILAKAVFADPKLTLDLPPKVTAATGMDALTHNVESYLSPAYHPICDGIALEGVRIAAKALPAAVRDGKNILARSDMMMASMMGAIAFQKDLGATHSCAHALGTVADMHHGLANGIMIDHVMRFNKSAALEKFHVLAQTVGVEKPSKDASADAFIDWLTKLKAEIGIPAKLSEVGINASHLDRLVAIAVPDICHQTNPRPCSKDDFVRMFTEAF